MRVTMVYTETNRTRVTGRHETFETRTLAPGHAAQNARLAQEPEGSDEAEERQAGGGPQNGGEIVRRPDRRSVLFIQLVSPLGGDVIRGS